MRDDLDAGVARLLQHRLEHVGVVWHHADGVDALSDQILDGAHLQGRIGAGRPDHEAVVAEFLGLFLDAGFHGVEPGNAADLDDNSDLDVFRLCIHCGDTQRCT